MLPTTFEQQNCTFGPPEEMGESRCGTIHAFKGEIKQGSCDGYPIVVVAWKPTEQELEELNKGGNVYLQMIGGLAPHIIGTSFQYVTNPS